MIRLYAGSGSAEIDLGADVTNPEEWAKTRGLAARLLRSSGQTEAANTLLEWPFDLREGTNSFSDEFHVMRINATVERYVEIEELRSKSASRAIFRSIAEAVSEVGPFIRFVAAGIDTSGEVAPVASPTLRITSDAVERALADAQQLLASRGASSGIDRVHTAFHGYLKNVCAQARTTCSWRVGEPGVAGLFGVIRKQHPAFAQTGTRASDMEKIANAMSNVASVLDPLRNRASGAHPNESVLEEPEAMLVINTVRTLLHYLDARLGK